MSTTAPVRRISLIKRHLMGHDGLDRRSCEEALVPDALMSTRCRQSTDMQRDKLSTRFQARLLVRATGNASRRKSCCVHGEGSEWQYFPLPRTK